MFMIRVSDPRETTESIAFMGYLIYMQHIIRKASEPYSTFMHLDVQVLKCLTEASLAWCQVDSHTYMDLVMSGTCVHMHLQDDAFLWILVRKFAEYAAPRCHSIKEMIL